MTMVAHSKQSGNGFASHSSSDASRSGPSAEPTEASQELPSRFTTQRRSSRDGERQDWWFAAMAIPMLAATTGPMANMFSIAAIVTPWRNVISDNGAASDVVSVEYPDPRWCIGLNVASLVCGCIGNLSLLLNFTRRIPYIVALPTTILCWYFSSAVLIAAEAAMHAYVPPRHPQQTYSQGFWYAVLAAVMYWLSATLLMGNMLGYFLGHYPRHFPLTDHQRTLILQTMILFIWLAGGAGIFARINGWTFCDALYFADVTILSIGFGDLVAQNNLARGLLLPYSIGGFVVLGLVINSINRFMADMSKDNVFRRHIEKQRARTIDKYSSSSTIENPRVQPTGTKVLGSSSDTKPPPPRSIKFAENPPPDHHPNSRDRRSTHSHQGIFRRLAISKTAQHGPGSESRLLALEHEKGRFDAMRHVQHRAHRWRRWYRLSMSVLAFTLVWCLGALGFWKVENREQGLTYFEGLYFCYVSLLTIGYGDKSPKSNAGKPLFVVWSLLAVPTMTILISDMADTVIASFNRGTFTLADWTILPKAGIWRAFLERHPWILSWLQRKSEERAAEKRMEEGFQTVDPTGDPPTLQDLAEEHYHESHHIRRLIIAIRRTAKDIHIRPPKKYPYEEWAKFSRLIRFSGETVAEAELEETTGSAIDWDWIGEDSPMMADRTEPEWVLDKLCDSLDLFFAKKYRAAGKRRKKAEDDKEREKEETTDHHGVADNDDDDDDSKT